MTGDETYNRPKLAIEVMRIDIVIAYDVDSMYAVGEILRAPSLFFYLWLSKMYLEYRKYSLSFQ